MWEAVQTNNLVQPYEGNEPYIFVSYSHRDNEIVQPLLEALSRAGYRVWYDAGIHAGTQWTTELANKIAESTVFMPLHSRASIQSDFCRREIAFAQDEGKIIIPVYLEDVELTRGLKLRLHAIQHRRLSNYSGADGFAASLEFEPAFAPCKMSHELQATMPEWNEDGGILWRFEKGVLIIKRKASGIMRNYEWQSNVARAQTPWGYSEYGYGEGIMTDDGYLHDIKSIVIQEGVLTIGAFAFSNCDNLTDIAIPDSVISIEKGAFYKCRKLTDINIPDSVEYVGDFAFSLSENLISAAIPAKALINENAFDKNTLVIRRK